jgi:hypothetical protein
MEACYRGPGRGSSAQLCYELLPWQMVAESRATTAPLLASATATPAGDRPSICGCALHIPQSDHNRFSMNSAHWKHAVRRG